MDGEYKIKGFFTRPLLDSLIFEGNFRANGKSIDGEVSDSLGKARINGTVDWENTGMKFTKRYVNGGVEEQWQLKRLNHIWIGGYSREGLMGDCLCEIPKEGESLWVPWEKILLFYSELLKIRGCEVAQLTLERYGELKIGDATISFIGGKKPSQ